MVYNLDSIIVSQIVPHRTEKHYPSWHKLRFSSHLFRGDYMCMFELKLGFKIFSNTLGFTLV
jgi:hypothetical protein